MKKLIIFGMLIFSSICQSQQIKEWTYPVMPGTEQWKAFQSHQEMVDACQIPKNVLKTISTEKLLQLCLDYPLLFDIYAFNQISNGFNSFYSSFNGIQELVKRHDAKDVLLMLYESKIQQQVKVLDNNVVSLMEKGKYKFKVSAIELFIGCPQMQSLLSDQQKTDIISVLMKGYEEKCKCLSENKKMAFQSNIYARANIINTIDSSLLSTKKLKQLTNGVGQDTEPIEQLNTLSYKLLQK